MGDTGSNLLGYMLAIIAVQGSLKTNAALALALPLVILAVPILDTSFVIAKRLKYRQPIYRADRWHFHHRMANIGFSQRRTVAYLYGWTLVLAGLALALRFIPYSDDRGHFDPFWTVLMATFIVFAIGASVYVIDVLEILKLRRFRQQEQTGPDADVDEGVRHELDTGSFAAVNPDTGEMEPVRPAEPESAR
jgi:UDP-GlcNAc:undecaprenyl-phosphate GlcNAc-1-phosphate transferase